MAITKLNSLAIPPNTIVESDLSYPLTNFSSTGIDDNATSTAVTIDASENVGIGEASPNSVLHVNSGTGNNTAFFESTDNGAIVSIADNAGSIQLRAIDTGDFVVQVGGDGATTGTNSTEAMRIDSSGNVGIGTTSPDTELHVEDATGNAVVQIEASATGFSGVFFGDVNDGDVGQIRYDHADNSMRFGTNTIAERMRIDSSGNVGIGTSSPDAQLTLNPPNYASTATGGMIKWKNSNNSGHSNVQSYFVSGEGTDLNIGANAYINTSGAWARWSTGLATSAVSCSRDGNINFITNTSSGDGLTRMTIDSSGRLLLGCTTSNGSYISSNHTQMNIQGNASGAIGSIMLRSQGTTNATAFELAASDGVAASYLWNGSASAMVFGTNNTERMRIDTSGNLLIGTTSTGSVTSGSSNGAYISSSANSAFSRTLTVNSSQIAFYNPNGFVGQISTSGTTTIYSTSSDVRLKENIVDAPAGNIDAIRVRSFDWKVDGTHQTYGMVAQELVDVAPEAVTQGETDDDMWQVDYSKLVPMMIKEIQDLKAEVAALKGA